VTVVRVCRRCGKPTALEDSDNRPGDPFACRGCLGDLICAPQIPAWMERAVDRLAAQE
jgi:hypothetical protein